MNKVMHRFLREKIIELITALIEEGYFEGDDLWEIVQEIKDALNHNR